MKVLSIIVPCYNEQEAIPKFYQEISKVFEQMKNEVEFELVFVDDGSADSTLKVAKQISEKDSRVKYVSFSRNFGKEAAMYAGLEKSTGDFVAIMDVDLQDPPELLLDMYRGIVNEGYDCVGTRRVTRKGEPPIRSFFARSFYAIINKISSTEIVDGARDYRLMTRSMVDSILNIKEYNRFSKGIFSWVGYKTKWLEYENVERVAGETKWSFWKLFMYSLEGIVAFSTFPLTIAFVLGVILFLISILMACVIGIRAVFLSAPVMGYSPIVCMVMLVGGIQLLCVGIIGQYLSKTYLEVKNRPIYITKEEN